MRLVVEMKVNGLSSMKPELRVQIERVENILGYGGFLRIEILN